MSGIERSMSQSSKAGLPSMFPASSSALTEKLCGPPLSSVYVFGLEQFSHPALSRLQWKVLLASFELKVNVASSEPLSSGGPESIVVSGFDLSMLKESFAGTLVFPAMSLALTSNRYVPSCNP